MGLGAVGARGVESAGVGNGCGWWGLVGGGGPNHASKVNDSGHNDTQDTKSDYDHSFNNIPRHCVSHAVRTTYHCPLTSAQNIDACDAAACRLRRMR